MAMYMTISDGKSEVIKGVHATGNHAGKIALTEDDIDIDLMRDIDEKQLKQLQGDKKMAGPKPEPDLITVGVENFEDGAALLDYSLKDTKHSNVIQLFIVDENSDAEEAYVAIVLSGCSVGVAVTGGTNGTALSYTVTIDFKKLKIGAKTKDEDGKFSQAASHEITFDKSYFG